MKTTIALENLWIYLQSLPKSNKKWLSERLMEDLAGEREAEYISKEEVLAGIDAGLKDMKAGRTKSFEQFMKEWEG